MNEFNFNGQMICFKGMINKILLMEEILHHLGCVNPVNSGINYLSTGARFLVFVVSPHFLFDFILPNNWKDTKP